MTPYCPAYKTHSGSIVAAFWLCVIYTIKNLGWIWFTFTFYDLKEMSELFNTKSS